MDFNHSADDVAGLIARLLRADLTVTDGDYVFSLRLLGASSERSLPKARLEELIASLRGKQLLDETGLYSDLSLEILVNEEGPLPMRRFRDEQISLHDAESNLTYEIAPASPEYLVWFIATVSASGSARDFGLGFFMSRHRLDRFGADPDSDVFDLVRALSSRMLTLRVASTTKQSLRRMQLAATSFMFHLAYNLDLAFVPQRYLEELSRRGRIRRMRRSATAELDPPRRSYNEDLVNHYVLAISTDSPTVQFLSYYHILEHFFEAVFNDELIEQVRSALTQPSFSYKRKKDIGSLISTIKRSLQVRSETITFSEPEALRLVLERYVDPADLAQRVSEYDATLIDYYRTTEVPFSKGAAVDLGSADRERALRDLGRRIYATRNSLVHSKDGDKARYIPFKDERSLLKEVPLLRFVAESITLSVSEIS